MEYSPNREQRLIIASRLTRSVVTASAGAGKTGVIVNHFRELVLQDGLKPDQILAITFTRKAAAEMKTRIVKDLRDAGRPDLAQIAETGPIQTIHAFCQRLLTENSIAAGVDPDFEIVSEGDKRRWQEEAIRETLAEDFFDIPEVHLVLQEFAGRRANEAGQVGQSPYGVIESSLRTLMGQMRGSGHSRAKINAAHASGEQTMRTWQQTLFDRLDRDIVEALEEPIEPGMPSDRFFTNIAQAYKSLRRSTPTYVKMVSDRDESDAAITSGLVQLACRAWQKLDAKMTMRSALDFTLLEERAIEALDDPSIRRRVSQQYRVALVDEAQDLNPLQYKLLDRLETERIMLVGDRQQSIYAFRQADVELFIDREAKAQMAGDGSHMTLVRNHRSEPGILRFVDSIFTPEWSENYRPMAPRPEPIATDDKVIELFGPEPEEFDFEGVELWPMELADAAEVARRTKDLLRNLPPGKSAKDVCVLVRDSSFGERLFRAFDRHQVPAKLVGVSKQYYTRMEIRDIANALRALGDPYDSFALAATLVSPFGGLSYDALTLLAQEKPLFDRLDPALLVEVPDDILKLQAFLAWFKPLSASADRMTAGEAVTALLGETSYLETLARRPNGAQVLANVRKLQRIACQAEEVGPVEFAEQIRETQSLRHDESDEPTQDEDSDAVSIMTIHRSKGLEFEIVIVPQTTSRIGRIRDEDVRFDPRVGLAAASFGVPRSRFFLWLQDLRREREKQEDWRVVYVALTRAKKRLCVVTRASGAHTVADAIAKHSGFKEGTPPGVIVRE